MKLIYKRLNPALMASISFFVCSFIQKSLNMLTTAIFTRIMTIEQYGMYNVYLSWNQIIYMIATFSIATGVYMQGLVKYENDRDNFTSSLQGLSTTLIISFFCVLLFFRNSLQTISGIPFSYFCCMFIDFIFVTSFNFWSRRERIDYKYKKLFIITIINAIFGTLIGFFSVVYSQDKAFARIISIIIVDMFLYLGLYIENFKKGKKFFSREYWSYAIKFNLPLLPHYLSQVILNQSDRIMIKNLCGSDKAGIYSLAYTVASIMMIMNNAVNQSLDPWLLKNIKEKNYKKIESVSYVLMICIAIVNIAMMLVAPEVIMIFAPGEYGEAVWIIPPVTASIFLMFMYNFFADFEFYYEKTKYIMVASLFAAISNIFLNAIFIPRFGYLIAGYTTLISYILSISGHFFFMRVICKKIINKKVYNGKIILFISIMFLLLSGFILILYNFNFIIRYLLVILVCSIVFIYRKKILEIKKELN